MGISIIIIFLMSTIRDQISITFDDENKIRVLDPEKFAETESMKLECNEFISKLMTFDESVEKLISVLDDQSEKIEAEKLRAVGESNQVEGESEERRKKQLELQILLKEKQQELDRLDFELESLCKWEFEQKTLIE